MHFVLPALAQGPFPFVELLQALLPAHVGGDVQTEEAEHHRSSDWLLTVQQSPWLLYAVLTLSEKHLGNVQLQNYWNDMKLSLNFMKTYLLCYVDDVA